MKELSINEMKQVGGGGFWLNIFRSDRLGKDSDVPTHFDTSHIVPVSESGGTYYIDDGKMCHKV